MTKLTTWHTLVVCLLVAACDTEAEAPAVPAEDPTFEEAREQHWCATEELWEAKKLELLQEHGPKHIALASGCQEEGICDDPVVRDGEPIEALTVNTVVHVMRRSNGSGGVSQATVDATLAQLNSDYAGTGVSFDLAQTQFHDNNSYSCISAYSPFSSAWQSDIANMKASYAVSPQDTLNIYISCQDSSIWGTLLGIATFPWDPDATTDQGGLWLNDIAAGAGSHTASHEVGHCLGLWHTHHGVSEVNSCTSCYEYADGTQGDLRGDFAADTPPTPTNYDCAAPGGSDCQGTPWGATQPENYMGYGPDACQDTFTANQTSRMQCWSKESLPGWLSAAAGTCGDGTCGAGEDCGSCAADCGPCGATCGDGTCDAGEDCSSCAADCGTCAAVCGDGTCDAGEDSCSCAADCPDDPNTCSSCECGSNGGGSCWCDSLCTFYGDCCSNKVAECG